MILLVVTGLAFGAQYVTPVETAEPCPAAITEKDFFEEIEEMRDPLVMEEFIDQWRYRMGTLK